MEWVDEDLDCLGRQRVGHPVEEGFGIVPGQAGIGDRHSVGQSFIRVPTLPATLQVTFKHDAHDGAPALLKLLQHFARDFDLALMVLA